MNLLLSFASVCLGLFAIYRALNAQSQEAITNGQWLTLKRFRTRPNHRRFGQADCRELSAHALHWSVWDKMWLARQQISIEKVLIARLSRSEMAVRRVEHPSNGLNPIRCSFALVQSVLRLGAVTQCRLCFGTTSS